MIRWKGDSAKLRRVVWQLLTVVGVVAAIGLASGAGNRW